MTTNVIYVHKPSDIPKREHWAIIGSTSINIPGDERSRTNPGHGYPESTEYYCTYEAYLDEEEFKKALLIKMDKHYNDVHGIHVTGDQFILKLSIDLVKS